MHVQRDRAIRIHPGTARVEREIVPGHIADAFLAVPPVGWLHRGGYRLPCPLLPHHVIVVVVSIDGFDAATLVIPVLRSGLLCG
jgi:hypothetical protein